MAYADEGMSTNRMIALGLVALLHAFLGYAFISGLALKAVKAIVNPLESVNIEEEAPPPEEPPPPPPKEVDIPPFVPPPEVSVQQESASAITVQNQVKQEAPPVFVQPKAEPAPPPPPAGPTTSAQFDPRSVGVSEDDYPAASLRAEEEGLVKVRVTIGTNGRVSACEVVSSSNFPRLDEKTCKLAQTRWRGKPALMNGSPVESTKVQAVRWQIKR